MAARQDNSTGKALVIVESLVGGDGLDTLDYSGSSFGGVTVDLAAGTAHGGFEVLGFESFIGTSNADTLTGGDGDNTLDGRGGADDLTGGLGNDTYIITQAFNGI